MYQRIKLSGMNRVMSFFLFFLAIMEGYGQNDEDVIRPFEGSLTFTSSFVVYDTSKYDYEKFQSSLRSRGVYFDSITFYLGESNMSLKTQMGEAILFSLIDKERSHQLDKFFMEDSCFVSNMDCRASNTSLNASSLISSSETYEYDGVYYTYSINNSLPLIQLAHIYEFAVYPGLLGFIKAMDAFPNVILIDYGICAFEFKLSRYEVYQIDSMIYELFPVNYQNWRDDESCSQVLPLAR